MPKENPEWETLQEGNPIKISKTSRIVPRRVKHGDDEYVVLQKQWRKKAKGSQWNNAKGVSIPIPKARDAIKEIKNLL